MSATWRPQYNGSDKVLSRDLSVMMDIISALSGKVKTLTESKVQPVSVDQVKQLLQPQNLVKHFQSGGDAPLNLTGLIGVTGSPQIAGIPILAALPTANDPKFVNTAAVVVGGVLYINNNGVFVGSTVGLTSIALAMPAGFGVAGSPLVANGTITVSISNAVTVRADIGAVALSDVNIWTALNAFSKTIIVNRQTYVGVVGTTTFNLANGNIIEFTFGAGNETIALSNVEDGAFYSIDMIQDSGGSRTATWPGTIKWVAGTPPTLSTGANQRDTFLFHSNGTNLYELARRGNVA